MGWFEYSLLLLIVMQVLFTIQVLCNYHYAVKKSTRQRTYRPECALIVPCKGLDETFDKNIRSFFTQDFKPYHLFFVVQESSDPAHSRLCELKERYETDSQAQSVQVLIAGPADSCSQKLHNLLFAYHQIPTEVQALVFADSDACVNPDWLAHIVYPLARQKNGAAGGYRCFVPQKNNVATLALAAVNAKVCQLMGNTPFNLAWGGSMAILVQNFKDFGIDRVWQKALSDDLSLSRAVRKNRRKMVFVPACMVASYEMTTWSKLWEFARRQFIITRIYAPKMWLFGLFNSIVTVGGLWGGLALAIWAAVSKPFFAPLYYTIPAIFFICQIWRAILRQKIIALLLPKDKDQLKPARLADIGFFWVWTVLLLLMILSSAVGRIITWKGIRYRLKSPTEIQVLSTKS
jgi:cellulose synthase/poly-beta-1,6-N-acetylglucosamine synthase-like glycosyltransferase